MTIHISGTNQEIFDRVCAHLAQQGRKSKSVMGGCVYRADDGARCAVGCLLPDDAPFASLDNLDDTSIRTLIRNGLVSTDPSVDLLAKLQEAHDENETARGLRNHLIDIAFQFSLVPDAAEQIEWWQR